MTATMALEIRVMFAVFSGQGYARLEWALAARRQARAESARAYERWRRTDPAVSRDLRRMKRESAVRVRRSAGPLQRPILCSVCRQPGHNARSCPKSAGRPEVAREAYRELQRGRMREYMRRKRAARAHARRRG